MNIAPLFKRFDELADAPERIPALRKVILAYLLHSAVNSPDAISRAATLREAHETRRRELIKSASRKEVPTVSDVVDEDLPPSLSDIPAVLFDRLGNIASIEKGLSQIQSTTPGKYPLVVTAETRSSSDSFDFEGAAAIIPLVSSTGHGDASLKRLHYQEGRYAVGNILAVVKPICADLLRARFIYEYLSAFKEELLVSRMVGTANVSLTVNKLKEVPVPLVSGPVLSRIDELMALCDRLEAQQQERATKHAALARASLARFADAPIVSNLKFLFHEAFSIPPADLRKSILTLAVQGKLVPQDPNDEPAEELLARLASEPTPEQRRNQAAPLAPLPEEALQYEVPDSWTWARFRDVAIIASNLVKPDEFLDFTHLAPDNIEKGNGVLLPCRTVREDKVISSNHRFYPGQIVYSKIRPNLAKVVVVDFEGLCSADMYPIDALIDAFYLQRYMLSESFLVQAVKTDTRVAMPKINQMELNAIAVPVPPLAEQRRIVAKVEQLMALVDTLETQLAASRATAANLLSALVAELTGTPNDGKVSVPSASPTGRRGRPRKSP